MDRKNKKGFSLAELLISLLIISLVLAAAIPTITKRSGASREQIWRWTTSNNDIYFGIGELQSAILGLQVMPSNVAYFYEEYGAESINADADKLAIVQQINDDDNTFEKSHIGFYTANKTSSSTASEGIKYAGRLALDRTNIALGIGSLQAQKNYVTNNTAIGHYALFHNDKGNSNTAVGYYSLANLANAADNDSNKSNIAFGTGACSSITKGSNNICLGNYSGYDPNGGEFTVQPGTKYSNNISNRIFIGSNNIKADGKPDVYNADIITGYTYYLNGKYDKELDVNTRKFQVRTFDGKKPMFSIIANRGATGYDNSSKEYLGSSDFSYYINEDTGSTQISANGSTNQININTPFAVSAKDANGRKYKGTINLNEGALSYKFNDSTKDTTKKKYRVDIDSDYELGLSSVNASVDISAQEELNLKSKYSTTGSAGVILTSKSDENKIELNASQKDYLTLSSKTNEGLKVSSANGINMYSEKIINFSGKSININAFGSENSDNINITSGKQVIIKSGAADDINISSGKDIHLTTSGTINLGSASSHINIKDRKIDNVSDVIINDIGSVKTRLNELSTTVSDIRLKDVTGDNNAGLKEINELKVKNFTYKNDKEKIPHVGVIAQDLRKIFPNSVIEDKNTGFLRIKTEEMFYAMVNSIKELFSRLQDLTARISGLDKRITELEKENQILKKQNEDFEKRLAKLENKK